MNGVTLSLVILGTILPEDSGATFEQKESLDVWACPEPRIGQVNKTLNNPPCHITPPLRHHL